MSLTFLWRAKSWQLMSDLEIPRQDESIRLITEEPRLILHFTQLNITITYCNVKSEYTQ